MRGVARLGARHDHRRRHARRRRHRPRHRVVPQPPVARLQDRRRHRAGSARAVPAARRRAAGARRRRSGRWWSSKRTMRWRRRRAGRGGSARGARGHLHARQGPGAVRARHARRAAAIGGTNTIIDEAGVDREVRRAAGVDSRLPRARRRRGRRLSRACPAGAPSRPRRCSRGSATSRPSRRTGASGSVNAANPARPGADARARARPRVAVPRLSRRCAPTSRCSTPSTTCDGRGRPALRPARRAARAAALTLTFRSNVSRVACRLTCVGPSAGRCMSVSALLKVLRGSVRDLAYHPARIAGGEHSFGYVARHDAAGADDGARADAHAGEDDRAAADPDVRADLDRLAELFPPPRSASSGCIGV